MGAIVRAACTCGYATGFTAGSGAGDPDGREAAPALCRTCGQVVTAWFPDPTACCPKCGAPVTFYSDPALQTDPRPGGVVLVPRTACECPRCGCKTLMFEAVGCWS